MQQTNITLLKHRTANGVVIAYFKNEYPKLSPIKIVNKKLNFNMELGEIKLVKAMKVMDMILAVRKYGLWGFCERLEGTSEAIIHYWIGKRKIDQSDEVLGLFMHELVHATGIKSEQKACDYAEMARFAYNILSENIYHKQPYSIPKKQ